MIESKYTLLNVIFDDIYRFYVIFILHFFVIDEFLSFIACKVGN